MNSPFPVRILYLNPFPDLGGAEHSLLSLLRTLPQGVEPILLTSAAGELERRARNAGVETHLVHLPARHIGQGWQSLSRLRALLRDRGIQLIHANSTRAALYGGVAGRQEGIPVIWHLREQFGTGPKTQLLKRLAQVWLGNSRAALDDAGILVEHPRARVAHNGLPREFVRPDPRPSFATGERPAVGMLARIEPLKGQREFLEAGRILMEGGQPARLLVGGSVVGPRSGRPLRRAQRYAQSLEQRVNRWGLTSRVRFLGRITNVGAFLDSLDILVVPSWREGFCRVVIEGMARGLPVVASEVGGIPEIIDTGDNGWLVPRRDPQALALALSFLLRHREHAAWLGERGRQKVLQSFSEEDCTRKIVSVYAETLGLPLAGFEPLPVAEQEVREILCT